MKISDKIPNEMIASVNDRNEMKCPGESYRIIIPSVMFTIIT